MTKELQSFNLEDFSNYRWTKILEQINPKKCDRYTEVFQAKAEKYRLEGDTLAQEIFSFLSKVTAFWIKTILWVDSIEKQNISFIEKTLSAEFSDSELNILRKKISYRSKKC